MEEAKRKRAERFGIPVVVETPVEPTLPKGGKAKGPSTKKAAGAKGKKPELLKGLNKNKKKKKG